MNYRGVSPSEKTAIGLYCMCSNVISLEVGKPELLILVLHSLSIMGSPFSLDHRRDTDYVKNKHSGNKTNM